MSGIFLNTADWAGGSIEFDDGTNPAETYAYDTQIGTPSATFYAVASDVVSWLNAAGRAWYGTITAALTVRSWPSTPRLAVDVAFTGGTFDVTGSGGLAAAYTGWADDTGLGSIDGDQVPSTAAAEARMSGWIPASSEPGARSVAGSWIMGGGGSLSDRRVPSVDLVMDEGRAAAFASALRSAPSPRHAHCYDSINDTWRLVALGAVRSRPEGLQHIRVSPQVSG